MLKASKESASHNIKIGIAWQMYIRDRQDEQPWPCSWVVAHTSESEYQVLEQGSVLESFPWIQSQHHHPILQEAEKKRKKKDIIQTNAISYIKMNIAMLKVIWRK